MSTIITINSLEKNVGVSNIVLTLGEKLNYFTKEKVCIVELDYENPSFSYTLERKSNADMNIDTILPYLSDSINDSLFGIIKHNARSFKNSEIDIIYGRTNNSPFREEQLKILIEALREMYDIVVIDYGDKILPEVLLNNTDMNLLVVQATTRYIEKLGRNKSDYVSKKTHLLLNNCAKGITDVSFILRDKFKDVNMIGQLPSSNTLVLNILRGTINIDKGDYANKCNKLAINICSQLGIKIKQKNSLITKVIGKGQERSSDVYMEQFRNLPLGEILLQEKICTKQQLERCLDIQARRLG